MDLHWDALYIRRRTNFFGAKRCKNNFCVCVKDRPHFKTIKQTGIKGKKVENLLKLIFSCDSCYVYCNL